MPNYTRFRVAGGTFFLTLVTYDRARWFDDPDNVRHLRRAVAQVRSELPFRVVGAVVLPDHLHFIWNLPHDDGNFSSRISRVKGLFTRAVVAIRPRALPASRQRRGEQVVWQRRFWEHAIRDERDLANHLDYIHYNPVKHAVASCPHAWPYSSFHRWVRTGQYSRDWYCVCRGEKPKAPRDLATSGE